MSQSVFKFEARHDYSPENFVVSACNRAAWEHVRSFPDNFYALGFYGPAGCGKTYLANIAAQNGAEVIEDINKSYDQRILLHKLNSIKETGGKVVLTSLSPLKEIGFTLPDLVSRLSAIPSVAIDEPDEELFYILFARYFAARQLKVSDDVISYLASRVERSFAAAAGAVEKIDRLSLESKRNITVPLVKECLI